MKDINLPITQTFSLTIDTHNIDMSNATLLKCLSNTEIDIYDTCIYLH